MMVSNYGKNSGLAKPAGLISEDYLEKVKLLRDNRAITRGFARASKISTRPTKVSEDEDGSAITLRIRRKCTTAGVR